MSNITIKQAQDSDISILENILLDTVNWLNEIEQPLWNAEDVTWNKLSKSYLISDFYIAYADDVSSGCMVLIDYDPFFWPNVKKGDSLFIHKLAVTKAARKSGIADALIDFFKKQGAERRVKTLRLDTDALRPKTRAFYERHKFEFIEEKIIGKFHVAFYVYKLITIRLAVPADAPDMAEVHMRSWEVAYKDIIPEDYIRQKNATRHDLYTRVITEDNTNSYVIQYAGKTVGIMKIAPPQDDDVGDDFYELHYIYLHPDYFRIGIGTQAMEFIFDKARSIGKTGMTVWVLDENIKSIKFYEKCGFQKDGKKMNNEYGKESGRIRMRRDL